MLTDSQQQCSENTQKDSKPIANKIQVSLYLGMMYQHNMNKFPLKGMSLKTQLNNFIVLYLFAQ